MGDRARNRDEERSERRKDVVDGPATVLAGMCASMGRQAVKFRARVRGPHLLFPCCRVVQRKRATDVRLSPRRAMLEAIGTVQGEATVREGHNRGHGPPQISTAWFRTQGRERRVSGRLAGQWGDAASNGSGSKASDNRPDSYAARQPDRRAARPRTGSFSSSGRSLRWPERALGPLFLASGFVSRQSRTAHLQPSPGSAPWPPSPPSANPLPHVRSPLRPSPRRLYAACTPPCSAPGTSRSHAVTPHARRAR
jgi:hypothetical protein